MLLSPEKDHKRQTHALIVSNEDVFVLKDFIRCKTCRHGSPPSSMKCHCGTGSNWKSEANKPIHQYPQSQGELVKKL